jgi:regulator of sirC expression with transglutaminase-like and TPR domain
MTDDPRQRLLRHVRHADADPARTALLCASALDPDLDVEVALLRVDALTDRLRVTGVDRRDAAATATSLADHLGGTGAAGTGWRVMEEWGTRSTAHLLPAVLDEREGAPLVIALLTAAIGRRLGARVFTIGLPTAALVGIASEPLPLLLDPRSGGARLDEAAVAAEVEAAGHAFRRAMLRPMSGQQLARRLLRGLTVALRAEHRGPEAVEISNWLLALPDPRPSDLHRHGELLSDVGRFDAAAALHDRVAANAGTDAVRDRARRAATDARARMN